MACCRLSWRTMQRVSAALTLVGIALVALLAAVGTYSWSSAFGLFSW
jgi:hypothetical protein